MVFDDSAWTSVTRWAIGGLLTALIMAAIALQRNKAEKSALANVLSHSKLLLAVGASGLLLFGGLLVVSNIFANSTTTWWTSALFAGFAVMSAAVILEYYRIEHRYSDDGLEYRRLFAAGGNLRWNLLASVRYSPAMKWFRLETHDGQVARISAYLTGLPGFARTLLKHIPTGVSDELTLDILAETAAGRPPAPW